MYTRVYRCLHISRILADCFVKSILSILCRRRGENLRNNCMPIFQNTLIRIRVSLRVYFICVHIFVFFKTSTNRVFRTFSPM